MLVKVASICYYDGDVVLSFVACCFYKTQKQHIGTNGLVKRLLFSVSFIRLKKKNCPGCSFESQWFELLWLASM